MKATIGNMEIKSGGEVSMSLSECRQKLRNFNPRPRRGDRFEENSPRNRTYIFDHYEAGNQLYYFDVVDSG